jgi:pantoate--beta-alanine ligase
MQTILSIKPLRDSLKTWRGQGETIAFVPTMGNLHAGHIHLVEQAKSQADKVVVSIFVNPTQFSAGEDFGAYPRTPDEDSAQLSAAGADLLFMPEAGEIYLGAAATFVEVPGISEVLCGAFRPGHFRGVATVVCKLLNITQPDLALFGEKDFQQLAVIRRMVADLNMPVQIIGVPTVRESGGLALSSRNHYLSEAEKQQAAALYQSLLAAQAQLEAGARDFRAIEAAQSDYLRGAGFRPDYFAIRRLDLAEPVGDESAFVILAAAWLGRARLIDNVQLRTG